MKDIRETLFAQYSNALEVAFQPTEQDIALNMALDALDDQTLDIIIDAIAGVMDEQVKKAFMAGFSAGTNTYRIAAAYPAAA